ncbi:MAG TPA: hypothetical protein V6C85_11990 [Allocoleopsis sp.]
MESNKTKLRHGSVGNNSLSFSTTDSITQPTLIGMGDDRPAYLMYPTHWQEALGQIPPAKKLARERDALLVLVLDGEIALDEMKSLVAEFALAQVIPLWLSEENQSKFNTAVAMHTYQQITSDRSLPEINAQTSKPTLKQQLFRFCRQVLTSTKRSHCN